MHLIFSFRSPELIVTPRVHGQSGVKQSVLSVRLSVSQSVTTVLQFISKLEFNWTLLEPFPDLIRVRVKVRVRV